VAARDPQVVFASWCGKRVRVEQIAARAEWQQVSAVVERRIYEVPSTIILQPGPASLTDGVQMLHRLLAAAAGE
jgi:iron complex transport system substrate-binding protein